MNIPGFESKTAVVGNVRIHYWQRGNAGGPDADHTTIQTGGGGAGGLKG